MVEPTDITSLLRQLPHLRAIATTGEKATATICATLAIAETPKTGTSTPIPGICNKDGEQITLHRLPSSSRAYPMSLEKKAEAYRHMFNAVFPE